MIKELLILVLCVPLHLCATLLVWATTCLEKFMTWLGYADEALP